MQTDMDDKTITRPRGTHPDVLVMGRPLREWAVEDTGGSTEEMFAWKRAVATTTGVLFDVAVGPRMAALFELRFEKLADEEHARGLIAEFEEGARSLGYQNARITSRYVIKPTDGSPRRDFGVARVGDAAVVIGRDGGKWREFDIMELLRDADIPA
jgi:hypothetical protein